MYKIWNFFLSIQDMFQQLDERIPYEQFASQMRQLNDEQHLIVDDILYKKTKN
jgi:hypothetical protein